MPFSSFFRKYSRGWTPRISTSDFYHRSTIRDIGRGSSIRSDFRSKADTTDEPSNKSPRTYEEVKASCLEAGSLWEDPDFPADDTSIYFKTPPSVWPDIEWQRPTELCDDAELFVGGASRMDVNQGILGDCWLLAAVSCLATNESLLHRVVPPDQSFSDDYAGVFRFQFWQYGRWVEVIVDDRLPTHNGKVIYMHSDERNEFWTALLEKAYAKLCGSYEALSGGLTSEALEDFTGGLSERYELQEKSKPDLLQQMLKARKVGALMGCSIDATPDSMESRLDNGLIIGHAYSITDVRMVEIETPRVSGQIPMIRVRNPWGDEHEWQGAWGDGSEEWQYIPDEEKETMGLTFDHDGEFWMAFDDFKDNFMKLEICYLGPDSKTEGMEEELTEGINMWEGQLMEGSWKGRINAGGCRNFPSFWSNPQYRINLDEEDDGDEDGLCTVIIGLMQKERRKLRKEGKDNHAVGYAIYELDNPNVGTLDARFFNSHKMAAKSTFINTREIADHHKLPPGHYVIVPSTFEPNEDADFVLRVFSEKPKEVKELDDETGDTEPDQEELGEDTEEEEEKKEEGSAAFRNLAGEDGEVDAYELQGILNGVFQKDFEFDGFSTDMTRSMVAMKDADFSGKLGYSDFKSLWGDLLLCKKVFSTLDTDGNSYFNSYEFRRALNLLGLKISNATFNAIVLRYSNKEGQVRFDDFVAGTIKLKTLFQTFKGKDEEGEGKAEFILDEFIQLTMYS